MTTATVVGVASGIETTGGTGGDAAMVEEGLADLLMAALVL